jgi:hypothetical protein
MDLSRALVTPDQLDEAEKQIEDVFTYHAWTPEQITQGNAVRWALQKAFLVILQNVPPSPDRTVALRKLREARMDANSAITHNGRY